jgi:hypothetical protein
MTRHEAKTHLSRLVGWMSNRRMAERSGSSPGTTATPLTECGVPKPWDGT